jgi:hypothetical protein
VSILKKKKREKDIICVLYYFIDQFEYFHVFTYLHINNNMYIVCRPRLTWDICIVMPMLIYLCVAMPFRLCFGNEAKLYTPIYYFEFMIDMIFLTDICFNFFTGYFVGREDLDNDLIEFDLFCIAKRYLKGWFIIDVSSGIPFSLVDLVFDQDSSSLTFLKSFKLLRFLRFLKLGRLLKFEKIFASVDRATMDDFEDFLQVCRPFASIFDFLIYF